MAHKDKPLIKDVLEDLVTTILIKDVLEDLVTTILIKDVLEDLVTTTLDCTPEELVEMYPKLEMFSTEIKLRIDEL